MISKEVLNEVLGYEIENIYELASKCKEQAYSKGYLLQSQVKECAIFEIDKYGFVVKILECIDSDTEVDAVLEATQWVYERINNETFS